MKYELPKEAWIPCNMFESEGELSAKNSIESISIHMRKITLPTKPKVSLEELCIAFEKGYESHPVGSLDEEIKAGVKSICTHLGIEIEPDKEEWEREFELLIPKGGEQISKVTFKQIFEAGQRNKEK